MIDPQTRQAIRAMRDGAPPPQPVTQSPLIPTKTPTTPEERKPVGFFGHLGAALQQTVGKPVTQLIGKGQNALESLPVALSQRHLRSKGYSDEEMSKAINDRLYANRQYLFLTPDKTEVNTPYDQTRSAFQNIIKDVNEIGSVGLQVGSLVAGPTGALRGATTFSQIARTVGRSALAEGSLSALGEFGMRMGGDENANELQAFLTGGVIGGLISGTGSILRRSKLASQAVEVVESATQNNPIRYKEVLQSNGLDMARVGRGIESLKKVNEEIAPVVKGLEELQTKVQVQTNALGELRVERLNAEKANLERTVITPQVKKLKEELTATRKALSTDYKSVKKIAVELAEDAFAKLPTNKASRLASTIADVASAVGKISSRTAPSNLLGLPKLIDDSLELLADPVFATKGIKNKTQSFTKSLKALKKDAEKIIETTREIEDFPMKARLAEVAKLERRLAVLETPEYKSAKAELDTRLRQLQKLTKERDRLMNDENLVKAQLLAEEVGGLDSLMTEYVQAGNKLIRKEVEQSVQKLSDKWWFLLKAFVDPFRVARQMEAGTGTTVATDTLHRVSSIMADMNESQARGMVQINEMFRKAGINIMDISKNFNRETYNRMYQRLSDIYDAMSSGNIDAINPTQAERELIVGIREFFDDAYARMSKAIEESGGDLSEIAKYRGNYLPLMEKARTINNLGIKFGDDMTVLADIALIDEKSMKLADQFNANLLVREGKVQNPEKNIAQLMMHYNLMAERTIAGAKSKAVVEPFITGLEKAGKKRAHRYFTYWYNSGIAGKMSITDQYVKALSEPYGFDLPNFMASASTVTARGSIAFSIRSITTQLSGFAQSFGNIGTIDGLIALGAVLTDKQTRAFAYSKSAALRRRAVDIGTKAYESASIPQRLLLLAQEALTAADMFIATHAWVAQVRRLNRSGLPQERVYRLADEFVDRVQGSYDRAFRAPIFNVKTLRPFTQFQNFPLNQFHMFTTDIAIELKEKGLRAVPGAALRYARMGASLATINMIYKSLGIPEPVEADPRAYIPFAGNIDILTGQDKTVSPFGAPVLVKTFQDFLTFVLAPTETARKDAWRGLKRNAPRFLPGGNAVFNQWLAGINTVAKGYYQIGNTRIPVKEPRQVMQAILFGPNGVSEVEEEWERLSKQRRNR
jgi:hypothetical protein